MSTPKSPYGPIVGNLVNLHRVVVPSKAQASLSVAIRVRPILKTEVAKNNRRDIIRVIDGKIVVVLDPDESKDYLDQVQNRTKEKKYTFDVAYDTMANNRDVYEGSIKELTAGVADGLNGTVFAYGSTGSGKTYTMVGTPHDPGLMVLSLAQIFSARDASSNDEQFTVTCSYLEVYNEVIYDLLVKNSGPLELHEDPEAGVCVAGLKRITVSTSEEIMGLLEEGNHRRKTDSTDANATSSRSHAVLEIIVRRVPRNHYASSELVGKLSLVDLAGSERAAETNNNGQKLRDGANINKSLLALANCINALGKQQKAGVAYVPYRNSKLTRLLKDSLSGNSRTAMVATISAASDQYHHSVNTLKYADRAKEIKTHVVQNVGTVERHIADYKNIIDNLQAEVQQLRARLAEKAPGSDSGSAVSVPGHGSGQPGGTAGVSLSEADTLAWIDALAQEINENIEERINLQKALFELEDINVCNKYELHNLEQMLEADEGVADGSSDGDQAEAVERRDQLMEDIAENEAAADRYRADIAANEQSRREIQQKIESAIDTNNNANFLKILSTFRIQAVRLQELKFQMAVRDQIITEQRDVISNLWKILEATGLSREQVMDLAKREGILMQGFMNDQGQGPPTVGASLLSAAINHAASGQKSGAAARQTKEDVAPLPASVRTEVQQSLMGGKARYRYRFWQQYAGANSSTPGSPSMHSSQLPKPDLSSPTFYVNRMAAKDSSPSRIPVLPRLRDIVQVAPAPVRSQGAAVGQAGRAHAKAASDHGGAPGGQSYIKDALLKAGSAPAVDNADSAAARQAGHASTSSSSPNTRRDTQDKPTGKSRHRTPSRSLSDISHERVEKASSHSKPSGSNPSFSTANKTMKRYTLGAPPPLYRHSIDASGASHVNPSSHAANHVHLQDPHTDEAAGEADAVSNPFLTADSPAKEPRRRRHGRQREQADGVGSSSHPAPHHHPGLPGQAAQVQATLLSLAQARASKTGGTQAWAEHQPTPLTVSEHKQAQIAAAYGASASPDKFAKLRKLQRRTVSGANSTTVSAEPSMADSEAVAAAYGGSSYHRESPHSSLQHAASHHSSVSGGGRPGAGGNKGVKATPRSEHSPSGAVVLPVISEARPQLAELRRRQLQKLHDHQQRKMSNA